MDIACICIKSQGALLYKGIRKMITVLNRKELFITYSIKKQSEIRDALYNNNIDYRIRTVNRMSPSPFSIGSRGRMGSFGQNMDVNYEYIFYVKKTDYDKAKHIINKLSI